MNEGYLLNKVPSPVAFGGNWKFYFLVGGSICSRSTCRRSLAWTAEGTVGEDVSSTIMSNWKWLFVSGCECESDFYCSRIFKSGAKWDKYVNVCIGYVQK